MDQDKLEFLWRGYSSLTLKFKGKLIVYDPADTISEADMQTLENVDLLIYSHGHFDHYQERVAKNLFEKFNCEVLSDEETYGRTRKFAGEKAYKLKPGESFELKGIKVKTFKGRHVGPENLYLVEVGDIGVFLGSDSGYPGDLSKTGKTDVAFTPVGHPSPTASPKDAFKMVKDLKPRFAVPIHGSRGEILQFKELIESQGLEVKVVVAEPYKPIEINL